MTFNEYQEKAQKTAIYPRDMATVYPALGLAGETGEVADKIKKVIRDHGGDFNEENRREIAKEMGDVLWYLAAMAGDLGYSLDDIAEMNLAKLASRQSRNQLHGNGDNR